MNHSEVGFIFFVLGVLAWKDETVLAVLCFLSSAIHVVQWLIS